MTKALLTFISFLLLNIWSLNAQVAINTDGSDPALSAMLEIKSTDKGLLLPRIADTNSIPGPAEGLVIYDLSSKCVRYFNGTSWSDCIGNPISSWSCGMVLTDTRDGQTYNTVQIGSQCWMAENLNYGALLTAGTAMTNNGIVEKYCYNNSTANCDVYGGLYGWNEMMNYTAVAGSKGICPKGWHVPTDAEWCTLEQFVDATITCGSQALRGTDGGGKLKEAGFSHWASPNTGATNSSGFTALPGGRWDGLFSYINTYAFWWNSTEFYDYNSYAWSRGISGTSPKADRNVNPKTFAFSVRCIKDLD